MTTWLDAVSFNADGLVPAIAQDYRTGRVLMMAWMNADSLLLTHEKEMAVYWSRSRQKLWAKGETSGHVQLVKEIRLDCDNDVIILQVEQIGGIACHTGRESCFYRVLKNNQWQTVDPVLKDPNAIYDNPVHADHLEPSEQTLAKLETYDVLTALNNTLSERKVASPDSSYVASLYAKGLNKILEKIGEEATETIIAAKDLAIDTANQQLEKDMIYEVADLWFHTMVMLSHFNVPVDAVTSELARRFGLSGLAEKAARA